MQGKKQKFKFRLALVVFAAILAMTGTASAGVGTNYNAVHNPPVEFVCDNDPTQPQCRYATYGAVSGLLSSSNAWAGDYRKATMTYSETAKSRWEVTTGDTGGWNSSYKVWAHIPNTGDEKGANAHYTGKECSMETPYSEPDGPCRFYDFGRKRQDYSYSVWINLGTVYIDDFSKFTVALTNDYGLYSEDAGKTVVFDAVDFWDD